MNRSNMIMNSRRMSFVALMVIAALAAPAIWAADAPPATQPEQSNGPQKFYGPMTAIDVKANTFTVGDQTYQVTGETQITKAADDSQATLADATVGEPARGTYTKTADGKLNVTKVRFGRKSGGSKSGGNKGGKKKTE